MRRIPVALVSLTLAAVAVRRPFSRSPTSEDREAIERHLQAIAKDCRSWSALDVRSGVRARFSAGASDAHHAQKLIRVSSRDPHAYLGVESGAPQSGQVLVLEAFALTPYRAPGPGRPPEDVVDTPLGPARPGASVGLFVMERVGETWRYATVSSEGEVGEFGRLAACVECHSKAPYDELFGAEFRR